MPQPMETPLPEPKPRPSAPVREPMERMTMERTAVFRMDPEKSAHVDGMKRLDAATTDLLNEYTGAYDAGTMTEQQVRDWIAEGRRDRNLWGITGPQGTPDTVDAFVYAPPDESKRIDTMVRRGIMTRPERGTTFVDLSVGRLPDVPDGTVTDGVEAALAELFARPEGDKTVVMYYMESDHPDVAPIKDAGFTNIGMLNYDNPNAPPGTQAVYRVTKESFLRHQQTKARAQLTATAAG